MTQIKIIYFASLKESSQKSEESIETKAKTPRELYEILSKEYAFKLPLELVKVAINEEYSSMDSILKKNDTVVFIPPVAGG